MNTLTEQAPIVSFPSRLWRRSRLLVMVVVVQGVFLVGLGVVLHIGLLALASLWISLAIPLNTLFFARRSRVHLTRVEVGPSVRLAWLERDRPETWTGDLATTAVQIGRDNGRGPLVLYLAFRDGVRPVVVQYASPEWPNDRLRRVFAAVREAQGSDISTADRAAMMGRWF
jgi:hypothetical protein